FNQPDFIENDPISIPHQFSKLQDIEIMGFWSSMLAWGQRKTIINKSNELIQLMDGAPYDFVLNHEEKDRAKFSDFKHRTFQLTDTIYFLAFFQEFYRNNYSLETAFSQFIRPEDEHIGNGLKGFHELFFSFPEAPQRTRKHVATPVRKSTCKRLNMFLRWMVRQDNNGVDFGLWTTIKPSQLLMPLDVHVDKVARKLNLLDRKQTDWLTVLELTEKLRTFDREDPVKYDFALFGLGVLGEL
ncbi:MAG: TIGR02757 family protein, partial [Bacteroidota bacterium]